MIYKQHGMIYNPPNEENLADKALLYPLDNISQTNATLPL